ncbi:hypothetical protein D3C80_1504360 [compost metagenome]
MESVPSTTEGRAKVSDGTVWARAAANSVVPRVDRVSAVTTSTGARVSRRERLGTRLPVTTMSSMAVVSAGASWAEAAPAISRAAPDAARNRLER